MAHKIKEIRQRLDEIAANKTKFHLVERRVDDRHLVHKERETHSFVKASEIIGREKDKERIVQLLLQSGDGGNMSAIPIVGIGGLGKTALAKLVYNDKAVEQNFELRMWVSVAEDFDIKKLMAKIIKGAEKIRLGENYGNLEMEELQRGLREKISGKKYLLILDDVCNEDPKKWWELKDLLMVGATGNKIVVTTRSNRVAEIMGTGTIPMHNLSVLPYDQCLSLFVKCAFKEGQEKQYPNLVSIGEEIVKKCGGVPLAVITLGSLLFSKIEELDWEFIRDNDLWRIEQKENDILPALRLSYEQLPLHLKRCFAYCSIFPKDYLFQHVIVVAFWMAHGLLNSLNENEELEDVGFRYLKELMHRCFFQDIEGVGLNFFFQMHDLMHDLAASVAKDDCLMLSTVSQHIPKNVRHISFPNSESLPQDLSLFLHNLAHASVRTISFFNEKEKGLSSESINDILQFKFLRMLDLSHSKIEVLPKRISILKHLRYLILQGNRNLKKLPNSICKLQNLQTLILEGCQIEELPKDIRHMISLRWLAITTMQKCLPKGGIGCLQSLQSLWIFGCENLEKLCEDIQGLKNLRTLFIVDCRSLVSLPQNMKCLTALEILVIQDCENLDLAMEERQDNLDRVGFGLKTLFIWGLPKLVDWPHWLLQGSTNTLQRLIIVECPNLRELPENLATLQYLEIYGCYELSERCQRETGEDWPKIADILNIFVDGVSQH